MLDSATLRVSDVMTTDVLTLDPDAMLPEALETLDDYGISGAPVVDGAGKCVGVFSITDLLRREQEIDEGTAPFAIGWYQLGPMTDLLRGLRDEIDAEAYDREVVGDWMTRGVKSVPPGATIEDAARLMADESIHRVLVMQGPRIVGIVTALDLVALIARTADEDEKASAAPQRTRARRQPRAKPKAKKKRR